MINTGGQLNSTGAGGTTSSGLIIPHSAVHATVGNSLTLQQQQQQPSPPTASGTTPVATSSSSTTSTSSTTAGRVNSSNSSQNNGGQCMHCHKTFRQLRSHIQDVHCPTPTPCPLCGKMFSSKHKMFGHKYRSCPNRTRNLVRHLQDLDHQQQEPPDSNASSAETFT